MECIVRRLGFDAVNRTGGGRPAYHPAALLKIYIYGYLYRIQSSRHLEREAQRNLELIWLTGRLAPDFKTIADLRKDNGDAITAVCSQFIALCRKMKVFSHAVVAIDGSKLKAVSSRDRNSTVGKVITTGLRAFLSPADAPVVLADYPNDLQLLKRALAGFGLPDDEGQAFGPLPARLRSASWTMG